jgi:dCTP deaminase
MGFWSTQRILARQSVAWLIADADHQPINLAATDGLKEAAYTLRLGPEVYVTSSSTREKRILAHGEQVSIPAGQFAVLLTEEFVHVPEDALALISIKAGVKFRGLVNVSGFHVDPGFEGRLLFSVFNAGSEALSLTRGDRLFPIWFSDLVSDDRTRERDASPYPPKGRHAQQSSISSNEVMNLQGHVASPGSLKSEFDKLRATFVTYKVVGGVVVAALLPALASVYIDFFRSRKSDATAAIPCLVPPSTSPTPPAPAPPPATQPSAPPQPAVPPSAAPLSSPAGHPPTAPGTNPAPRKK